VLRLFKRKWFWALVVVFALVAIGRSVSRGPTIEPGTFLLVDLEGSYQEGPPVSLLGKLLDEHGSYVELIEALRKATVDPRVAGLLVRIGTLEIGWAQAREIRESLLAARVAGKRVVAYLDNELGGANIGYYVASAADGIHLPPGAATMLTGLAARFLFFGGVWEKIDVSMESQQIREYKTFADTITRKEMSPAHREMANWLLDGLNDEFVAAIADSRGIGVPEVLSTIDSCPSSAQDYVEARLADKIIFFDDLLVEIGGGKPVKLVSEQAYARVTPESVGIGGGAKIAVIHAVGNIVGGETPRRGAMGSSIGSRTLVRAFRTAVEDESVKAIVLRIDSPGGSAAASDIVWHAARAANLKKPVIASLGDVAASGGYYMAAGAERIVAEPGTLTGSIGVVLLKPDLSGLLTRVGIGTDAVGRGRYSRLMDLTKPMDKAEAALVKTQMTAVYRRFLDRVAEGRRLTVEEVDAIGGGRVWTGHQAKERGLVDELGGLQDAVRMAATQAGIPDPARVTWTHLPRAKTPLHELLADYAANATVALAMPVALRDTIEQSVGLYATVEPGVQALVAQSVAIR
jgi:protease-4